MTVAAVRHDVTADGAVHRLVLDDPPANVVGRSTCEELGRALAAAADASAAKLVILEGAGKHFSYGASVEEHLPEDAPAMLAALHRVVEALALAPVPTLAAVRGRCLGGGLELALACGLVFVEEGAVLAAPEIRLGVFAPAATALLAGAVPRTVAEEVLLTGRDITAAEAVAWGLANRVVPAGGLEAAVDELVGSAILPRSAASLRVATRALREGWRQGLVDRLRAAERRYVDEILPLHDGTEGIRAFLERREPRWENR